MNLPHKDNWNRTFKSSFVPTPNPKGCVEKISEAFKNSDIEHLVVIISHGGVVDAGTQQKIRQPMFRSGFDVIFPVKYGQWLDDLNQSTYFDIASNIPLPTMHYPTLKGSQLMHGLNRLNFKDKCYTQYDEKSMVPNLEIFTSGEYIGDDGIYIINIKERDKTMHVLRESESMENLQLRRTRKVIEKRKETTEEGKTVTKKYNLVPSLRTSTKFKKKTHQLKSQPMTLADLCDAEHGTLKKLKLSNVAVLVIACRSGIEGQKNISVGSPTADKYASESEGASEGESSLMEDTTRQLLQDQPDQMYQPDQMHQPSHTVEDDFNPFAFERPFTADDANAFGGGGTNVKPKKRKNKTKKRRYRKCKRA
jgi:hypothetical protein